MISLFILNFDFAYDCIDKDQTSHFIIIIFLHAYLYIYESILTEVHMIFNLYPQSWHCILNHHYFGFVPVKPRVLSDRHLMCGHHPLFSS